MIIFKKAADLQVWLTLHRQQGLKIGFVPTMGALHSGHLSLIERSRTDTSITVCSIFVNPAQFNDPKDFEKYPITLDKDIEMLEAKSVDLLFLPSVEEIYPQGYTVGQHYDLGYLETVLEGRFRAGHFQGVCKVVHRLLDIVKPHELFLGQKDYQQCMVITKLIELTGMRDSVHVTICPTLREPDGLAMSSRNIRLSKEERERAIAIFSTLNYIRKNLLKGSLEKLKKTAFARLLELGFRPDYTEIADAATLELVDDWDGKRKLVVLIAAYLNEVRLIDNMLLNE